MSVILALDIGEERIGVAVTAEDETTALAHGVIPAQPLDTAIHAVTTLARTEGAVRLIVGLPLTLEGQEGRQASNIRRVAEAFHRALNLPMEFVDERFTSRAAARLAQEKGSAVDAEAARLILETWLARQGQR